MTDNKHQKLIEIIKEAIERDEELRKANEIGDKFRFIRDRLNQLLKQIEAAIQAEVQEETQSSKVLSINDEKLVYVYLFNAHGMDLNSWTKMISPKGFYEYSVNRPIYLEKTHIETVIRNKKNKAQHAYLVVALNAKDIVQTESGKDTLGYPLAKVREGSLHLSKLVSFIHNDHRYTFEPGKLIRSS